MSKCELCQHFSDVTYPDSTGIWSCNVHTVDEEEFGQRMVDDDEMADCPHWYPSEKQGLYVFSEGEWEHRCKRMPTDTQAFWDDGLKQWYVFPGAQDEVYVLFCPWCGIELQPMPEA